MRKEVTSNDECKRIALKIKELSTTDEMAKAILSNPDMFSKEEQQEHLLNKIGITEDEFTDYVILTAIRAYEKSPEIIKEILDDENIEQGIKDLLSITLLGVEEKSN
jgi:uncharacterized protein YjaG (DUF416 family)